MSETPTIVFAHPKPEEVWRAYVGDKVKIRELNSGIVQVAADDGDWTPVNAA